MSKNATTKRRQKARHRVEFSSSYLSLAYLNHLIGSIPPRTTPLIELLSREMRSL